MRIRGTALIALAIVCALLSPAVALAADAAPPATGDMEVQFWLAVEKDASIAIISVVLPPSAKLPATVRIPVPAGTKVEWAGEIQGMTAADDIPSEFKLVESPKGDYAEFVVRKSHNAQIEVGGIGLTDGPRGKTSVIQWTQSAQAPTTSFSVRLPSEAVQAEISPTPASGPRRNADGESIYTLPMKEMKVGDAMRLSATYRTTPLTEPVKRTSLPYEKIILVLAGLATAALGMLFVVVQRQRAAMVNATSDSDDSSGA